MPKAKGTSVAQRKARDDEKNKASDAIAFPAHSEEMKDSARKKDDEISDTKKEPKSSQQEPLFFYNETKSATGFLCPWYKAPFHEDGVEYQSVGHAIVAHKARIFKDEVKCAP